MKLKVVLLLALLPFFGCDKLKLSDDAPAARLAMFIGVDVSGSFLRGGYFDDSLKFTAHYLYAHLKGYGDLEVPGTLFVSSIGGVRSDDPKTLYPIQTFQNKSVGEIEAKLRQIFPKKRENPYTDYNTFFRQVATFARNKNLVLRPITIVMISDGYPDDPKMQKDYRRIELDPLENLSRNVTLRLLYTKPDVGMNWQTKVRRKRVKIWTQDAAVMRDWKDRNILVPGKPLQNQDKFLSWVSDNVDFAPRAKRVN